MKKADATEKEYNEWLIQKTASYEGMDYSSKRMDLLIVSISGAIIYIVFQTLKFMFDKSSVVPTDYTAILKISGVLALIAILLNFLSQSFGYKANQSEALLSQHVLKNIRNGKWNSKNRGQQYSDLSCNADTYSDNTRRLNKWSMYVMLLATAFIVAFSLLTFKV